MPYVAHRPNLQPASMKRGESKTSKGGLRNKAKDVVDIDHLVDSWMELPKKGCEILSSFGEYQDVWAECARRPDLADLVEMARCMAKVSPVLVVARQKANPKAQLQV